jgi:threonine/homoserine/homoserine lactone efflux protein
VDVIVLIALVWLFLLVLAQPGADVTLCLINGARRRC